MVYIIVVSADEFMMIFYVFNINDSGLLKMHNTALLIFRYP